MPQNEFKSYQGHDVGRATMEEFNVSKESFKANKTSNLDKQDSIVSRKPGSKKADRVDTKQESIKETDMDFYKRRIINKFNTQEETYKRSNSSTKLNTQKNILDKKDVIEVTGIKYERTSVKKNSKVSPSKNSYDNGYDVHIKDKNIMRNNIQAQRAYNRPNEKRQNSAKSEAVKQVYNPADRHKHRSFGYLELRPSTRGRNDRRQTLLLIT